MNAYVRNRKLYQIVFEKIVLEIVRNRNRNTTLARTSASIPKKSPVNRIIKESSKSKYADILTDLYVFTLLYTVLAGSIIAFALTIACRNRGKRAFFAGNSLEASRFHPRLSRIRHFCQVSALPV